MEQTVSDLHIKESTDKIYNALQDASHEIRRLEEELRALQTAKYLSIIHLAQYKNDYDALHEMYRKYKEYLTYGLQMHPPIQQQQPAPVPMQMMGQQMKNTQQIQQAPPQMPIQPQKPNLVKTEIQETPQLQQMPPQYIEEQPQMQHSHPPPTPTKKQEDTTALTPVNPQYTIHANDPAYNSDHMKLKYALSTNAVVCSVAFNSDGSKFAFTNTKTIFVINTADGSIFTKINMIYEQNINEFNPRCLRFTPDGRYIVLGHDESNILVFSVATASHVRTLKQHTRNISSIIFTNDNKYMVTAGYDCLICVWNLEDFSLVNKITNQTDQPEDMIVSIAVDSDKTFIAVGFMKGNIGIYDVNFKEPMLPFKAHDVSIMNIAISPFDSSIATGGNDASIKIWGLSTRLTQKNTLSGHTNLVLALAFKHDGPLLLSGSKDEMVCGWDYKKGTMLFDIDAHKNTVFSIAHHPSKNIFLSCSGEGLVCVWEYGL